MKDHKLFFHLIYGFYILTSYMVHFLLFFYILLPFKILL